MLSKLLVGEGQLSSSPKRAALATSQAGPLGSTGALVALQSPKQAWLLGELACAAALKRIGTGSGCMAPPMQGEKGSLALSSLSVRSLQAHRACRSPRLLLVGLLRKERRLSRDRPVAVRDKLRPGAAPGCASLVLRLLCCWCSMRCTAARPEGSADLPPASSFGSAAPSCRAG